MSATGPDHRQLRSDAPPAASEDIHLPGPSYLPIVVAAGITVALVGLLLSPLVFLAGTLIFLIATLVWIRDARREISEFPLDHG